MQRRICEAAHVAGHIKYMDFRYFNEYFTSNGKVKLGLGEREGERQNKEVEDGKEEEEIMFDSYHKLPEHNG